MPTVPWYAHARVLMKAKRITQADLAESLGLSQGAISHFFTGRREPSMEQITKIAQILGKEVDELLSEEELMHIEYYSKHRPPEPITTLVPLISWQRAKDNCGMIPGEVERGAEYVLVPHNLERGSYALRVADDSMLNPSGAPTFPEGSVIVVNPRLEPAPGNLVVVCGGGSNISFRQLVRDAETLLLKPLNPRYPITKKAKRMRYCGVVVGKAYESFV